MSTSSAQRSASGSINTHFGLTASPTLSPMSQDEPDEEWKRNTQKEIERGLQSMIQEAKDRLESRIQALTLPKDSTAFLEQKETFVAAYQVEADLIRNLAQEQFQHTLGQERITRRLTRGGTINETVQSSLEEGQAAIYAAIQRRRDSTTGPAPQTQTNTAAASTAPTVNTSTNGIYVQKAPPDATDPPTGSTFASSARTGVPRRWSPEASKSSVMPAQPDAPPQTTRATSAAHAATSPVSSTSQGARFDPSRQGSAPSLMVPHPGLPTGGSGSVGRTLPGALKSTATSSHPNRPPSSQPYAAAPLPLTSEARPASLGRSASERWRQPAGAVPPPMGRTVTDQYPTVSPTASTAHSSPATPSAAPTSPSTRFDSSQQTSVPVAAPEPSLQAGTSIDAQLPLRSGPFHQRSATSNTWKEATKEPPLPATEWHHKKTAPLNTKRSQASFRASPPPALGPFAKRDETWTHTELTEEPEDFSASEHAVPLPGRRKDAAVAGMPAAGSPPVSRQPPQIWTPSSTPGDEVSQARSRGSSLRPKPSVARKPIPSFNEEPTPPSTPPPVAMDKNLEREAQRRQEQQRQWENMDKTRGKEKEKSDSLGRAGGARINSASDHVPRRNDYVSGGSTMHVEGSSMPPRPSDITSSSPYAGPTHAAGPQQTSVSNPSLPRSSYLSTSSVSNSTPNVSPSTFGRSPPTSEDDDDPSIASASVSSSSVASPVMQPSNQGSPGPYDNRTFSHSRAEPIPVPPRSRTPEDEQLAYSAGDYSRYMIPRPLSQVPADSPSDYKYAESPALSSSVGSFSSRGEEAIAVELERERVQKLEEEAQRKVEEARLKAEEARLKEEAARKKEEELAHQQAEANRKLKELDEKEAELKRREAQIKKREEEDKQKEAARLKVEADMKKREEDNRQREAARLRDEAERQRKERERQKAEEDKSRSEADKQAEQQREFQKREAEIKRRTEERKRQNTTDPDSAWTSWGTPASPSPSNATSSSTRSSTSGSTTSGPTWSSSSRASTASTTSASSTRSSTTPNPGAKPSWTTNSTSTQPNSPPYLPGAGSQSARPSTGPSRSNTSSQPNSPPSTAEERARRQREAAEEQFRRMQEQLERERLAKEQKAGRILGKEDVVRIYQQHEQLWAKMSLHTEVTWDMLPWPVFKRANTAEDITLGAVDAYIMSPQHPDPDKSTKDRIRQLLRRWHEDHFNQKVLSKVAERDKERVKVAAGTVTRNLNSLLERANESKKSAANFFG